MSAQASTADEEIGIDWEAFFDEHDLHGDGTAKVAGMASLYLDYVDEHEAQEALEDAKTDGVLQQIDGQWFPAGYEADEGSDQPTSLDELLGGRPEPEEMDSGEKDAEIRELRETVGELEETVDQLVDIVTGEYDLAIAHSYTNDDGGLLDRVEDLEDGAIEPDEQAKASGARDSMLSVHKMYADVISDGGHQLGELQERAARLFGEFVRLVVDGEITKADASGQHYSMNTDAAVKALIAPHDPEKKNLLAGAKKSSHSTLAGRAMREVARLSRPGAACFPDEDNPDERNCGPIEECSHAVVRFNAGRPNSLESPKAMFEAHMAEVYDDLADDASETGAEATADDDDSGGDGQ